MATIMADVKISELPAISAVNLTGNELLVLSAGNTTYKGTLATIVDYIAGAINGYSNTITLNGGANNGLINNYIDLFSPRIGNRINKTYVEVAGLLPSNDATFISVVLTNGNPANDIILASASNTAELNESGLTAFSIDMETVATGFTVKALVTGTTVTAGTIKVIVNYLP